MNVHLSVSFTRAHHLSRTVFTNPSLSDLSGDSLASACASGAVLPRLTSLCAGPRITLALDAEARVTAGVRGMLSLFLWSIAGAAVGLGIFFWCWLAVLTPWRTELRFALPHWVGWGRNV